jgi:hypothetical protein
VTLPLRDWHLHGTCMAPAYHLPATCLARTVVGNRHRPEGVPPHMPRYRAILIALLIVLPLVLVACGKGGGGY